MNEPERLLFDLAGELRRVPIHSTVRIHLRALQIKRLVTRWPEEGPDEATRRAVVDEIVALRSEVEAVKLGVLRPRDVVFALAG